MLDKLNLIIKISGAMTVDPEKRKSQLSPIKYGYIKGRTAYFIMVILNAKDILLLSKDDLVQLNDLYVNHPEALPSVFWPYQHSKWNLNKRLDALCNHFETQPLVSDLFNCGRYSKKTVVSLSDFYRGMDIVVDRNGIFLREGMIVFSIDIDGERMFSIAFSLIRDGSSKVVSVIGAIQGRKKDGINSLYHDITKKMFGIRPRDLTVELFQMICKATGVGKIYAISELYRQQRHVFYSFKDKHDFLMLNYDEVWSDRGGVYCNAGFYELPVNPERRSIESIISKKRSMYKKRYELLSLIEKKVFSDINSMNAGHLGNVIG
ncbi:MAG: DUF535 family protein [Candidatus Thiodiazotropha sp. DIVDIV]